MNAEVAELSSTFGDRFNHYESSLSVEKITDSGVRLHAPEAADD